MTVTIASVVFNRVVYDAHGDVLYLSVDGPRDAASSYATPEGHAVRCDENGEIIGITLVNAKWLLDRDGEIAITVREHHSVTADDIRPALVGAS